MVLEQDCEELLAAVLEITTIHWLNFLGGARGGGGGGLYMYSMDVHVHVYSTSVFC